MTDCLVGDVNYNLCVVMTERMAQQQERLDLIWYGSWALVGLMFVLLLATKWYSVFKVTRGW